MVCSTLALWWEARPLPCTGSQQEQLRDQFHNRRRRRWNDQNGHGTHVRGDFGWAASPVSPVATSIGAVNASGRQDLKSTNTGQNTQLRDAIDMADATSCGRQAIGRQQVAAQAVGTDRD